MSSLLTDYRLTGQKLHFAMWNAYGATLWLLKASLLVLYMRLTVSCAEHHSPLQSS
jgi:hypothetical protein